MNNFALNRKLQVALLAAGMIVLNFTTNQPAVSNPNSQMAPSAATQVLAKISSSEPVSIESAGSAGEIAFTNATFTEPEGGGNAVISLRRTLSDTSASVRVTSANGSASAGTDYTAINQVVNWANGDTADKTVTVSVVDDDEVEGDETVTLTLSQVQGASLGTPTVATLTIIDNDINQASALRFDAANYDVNEGDGTVVARVRRTGGSSGAVSVGYATNAVTATAGDDYVTTNGTLDWADGDGATKTFEVQLIDDGETEVMETFTVALDNPIGNASLGSPNTAVVNVADNDFANCVANETTICILDDRFQVRVFFQAPGGNGDFAKGGEFTPESGFFTFFTDDNVEVLVKAIDACAPPFNRYWIFAAGLTNVLVRIEVTDIETGTLKTYNNPQGQTFEAVLDVDAFDTCP